MATHPSVTCICHQDPCTCLTLNQKRLAAGLPELSLVEPLYSPRIRGNRPLVRFTIEIHRRHLRLLPPAAALIAAAVTLGVLSGLSAVIITGAGYLGTALLMAAVERFVEWRQERRHDRSIERSISLYSGPLPHHPKHIGGTSA